MNARCRSCRGRMDEEPIGNLPPRLAWWCPRCRLVDLEPIRLLPDYPRSSGDRAEQEANGAA